MLVGGTVDVTCVSRNNKDAGFEQENHDSTGGRLGGETINERFEEFLLKESPDLYEFKNAFEDAIQDAENFREDYKIAKRRFDKKRDQTIRLDPQFLESYHKATKKHFLEELSKKDEGMVDEAKQRGESRMTT